MKNNWFNSHELLWNMVQFHRAGNVASLFICLCCCVSLHSGRVGNSSVYTKKVWVCFFAEKKSLFWRLWKFNIFTAWYWSITVKESIRTTLTVHETLRGLCSAILYFTRFLYGNKNACTSQDSQVDPRVHCAHNKRSVGSSFSEQRRKWEQDKIENG